MAQLQVRELENRGLDVPPGRFPERPVSPPGADGQWEGVSNLHEETCQAPRSPVGTGRPAPGPEAGGHPEGPEAGTRPSLCVWGAELRGLGEGAQGRRAPVRTGPPSKEFYRIYLNSSRKGEGRLSQVRGM